MKQPRIVFRALPKIALLNPEETPEDSNALAKSIVLKRVQVKGGVRKDGAVVKPHTRMQKVSGGDDKDEKREKAKDGESPRASNNTPAPKTESAPSPRENASDDKPEKATESKSDNAAENENDKPHNPYRERAINTIEKALRESGKPTEDAERLMNGAINAAFNSVTENRLSVVPDYDGAVFANYLKQRGAYPLKYYRYEHDEFSLLLIRERDIRTKAADEKIINEKFGGPLTRNIRGKTCKFVEYRDNKGNWHGDVYIEKNLVPPVLIDRAAEGMYPGKVKPDLSEVFSVEGEAKGPYSVRATPETIQAQKDLVALRDEGMERLKKLDPSIAEKLSRIYLNVPYKDKDEAKAAGAKWDAFERKWYAPNKDVAKRLNHFNPNPIKDDEADKKVESKTEGKDAAAQNSPITKEMLNKLAAATNDEIYDAEYNGGEWMTEHVETAETLDDFVNSSRHYNESTAAKRGEIAGFPFVAFTKIQPRKGDPRRSLSVIDFGEKRIALDGTDLTDFT
ncbi:MAG: DUF5710 domain-containing protein [Burkholderiales bacterium]|jgi:hypothetical protein|nr:DUF5710 domain-containing protein [Burkholderiales bacterium]